MASAQPVTFLILIAIGSALLFPPLWWILSYWQCKIKQSRLSKISLFLSVIPILSIGVLFLGKSIFPAKLSVLTFSLSPFFSLVLFIVIMAITIAKSHQRNDL
ncbi:hypothetical protein QCD60_25935 [Pokkaliibacter sp. MBI-7]|uniref:hypothetical protein n=1 Tax=Pokkaliibacter sp. MBI-7 TaxID=3040600 RepID=UPI002448861A|nr:hypothetical protein [Pokkaliibacter sp. MBI-7]MDH2435976.1 hypothetical protein [Pokkaliibacter sp. MBI-7]